MRSSASSAQVQASLRKAPGHLLPLDLHQMQAREAAEAVPHQGVKMLQGGLLGQGRVASHAVEKPGVARASTEETESHLGIFELSYGFEEGCCFGHPCGRVVRHEGITADGSFQELEVAEDSVNTTVTPKQGSG